MTALAAMPAMAQEAAAAAATTPAPATEDARLAAFFEEVFQRGVKDSPIFQAYLGIKGPDYGKWNDFSDEEAQRQDELTKQDLQRLHAEFDYDKLSEPLKISYRIFEVQTQSSIDAFPWRFHGYAFQTQTNPVSQAATFMQNIHSVDSVADAEAYVSRLEGVQKAMEQGIVVMNEAARRGIVPTSYSFDPVLGDSRNVISGAPFDDSGKDSAILADFRGKVEKLKADDATKKRLLDDGIAALKGPFQTGVQEMVTAIEALRAKSPGPHGVWKLPDGDAYYKNQIKFWTTEPDLTAEQIHDIGLAEVARIKGEMQAIMKQVGFEGDLPAFFEHLRTDPKNFFPNTPDGKQAYLDQSKAYIDSIYSDVEQYFNVLPKAPARGPGGRRMARGDGADRLLQPADPGRQPPGHLLREPARHVDAAEARDGDRRLPRGRAGPPLPDRDPAGAGGRADVPEVRLLRRLRRGLGPLRRAPRQGGGTLQGPDAGLRPAAERDAARLPPRRGHGRARQAMDARADDRLHDVEQPDDRRGRHQGDERYIDNPGQALSYKIGMIKILELREKAKSSLGPKFDIRDFHDVVLKNGAVPLPVLEGLVNDYIAAKK